jgi:hypothetical protein
MYAPMLKNVNGGAISGYKLVVDAPHVGKIESKAFGFIYHELEFIEQIDTSRRDNLRKT